VSGHMSSSLSAPPRRQLAGRPVDTVSALVEAAVIEVAATGFDGLTIRNVARRAGVSSATAYTYFASKEHLLTEVFWRRLSAIDDTTFDRRQPVAQRVADTVREIALLVDDEPELAAGITTAMLAHDSNVKVLRDQIGVACAVRLSHALGPQADDKALQTLTMTFVGALLSAGMGNVSYADLPGIMADATTLVVRRAR
jgi:AcrR family transcriptional regulator